MNYQTFERVSPESVGVSSEAVYQYVRDLEDSGTEMHGLMIMRHGKVCAEGWWSPYAPGIRHGLQSLSKTYAATGVGLAITEGLLSLDERVIDIFPDESPINPDANLQALRVRDVLCMGCGMDEMPRPSKDWIRDFLATPVKHKPGTTFMYNSVGSTLLAAMVCRRCGTSLQEYLTERLFNKIGIDASNLRWMTMPDGTEVGGGGLFATTEDNLRLMKLYLDGGLHDGERLLSEEYVRLAATCQNESAAEALHNPAAKDNFLGYGYQIWMCKPDGIYRADGAMGQFAIVCPKHDMIISINETAVGAEGAQRTLDITWKFLAGIRSVETLPENQAAQTKLSSYLSTRALERPPFAPYHPSVERLENRIFDIVEGHFDIKPTIAAMMSGNKPQDIRRISFAFIPSGCDMIIAGDGREQCLHIAMDGSRALNCYDSTDDIMTQVLLSGAWTCDGAFAVRTRWIETCFEREVVFRPLENGSLEITGKATVGVFPVSQPGQMAIGVKV